MWSRIFIGILVGVVLLSPCLCKNKNNTKRKLAKNKMADDIKQLQADIEAMANDMNEANNANQAAIEAMSTALNTVIDKVYKDWECYYWTTQDRQAISGSSEKTVCESKGNTFTQGNNGDYDGCKTCFCCKPVIKPRV